MIDAMLTTLKAVNDVNVEKYNAKLESSRQKKKVENRLAEIAALYNQGLSQKEIGVKLGISQQAVSYRLRTIREEFAELLSENSGATPHKENACTNFVQVGTKVEIGKQAEIERKKAEFYF
jgi:predicted transcriptional regulator